MRFRVVAFLGIGIAAACGGSVEVGGTGGIGGVGGTSGSSGTGGRPRDAGPDVKDARADVKDALSDYVEDLGCGDAAPAPPLEQCDPFQNPTGCPAGEACFLFVEPPSGPCGTEHYGTMCMTPGTATQGEPCDAGNLCAAGFDCVITGQGNQCVQLCQLGVNGQCPPGLLCVQIDVEGFGGCF